MYLYIFFMLTFGFVYSNILEENNFIRPKIARNILNKGVWLKKIRDNVVKSKTEFLFRPNSLDVDNLLQNNIDAFGDNNMQVIPHFTSYVERAKRSANYKNKRIPRKSVKNCKNKIDCIKTNNEKYKLLDILITDLKPLTVYNDYPHEIANLLNNNVINIEEEKNISKVNITKNIEKETENELNIKDVSDMNVLNSINNTLYNKTVPKRNKKHDYYNNEPQNIEFVEDFNKTDGEHLVLKADRGVKNWNINDHSYDRNMYNIAPKTDSERSKPVTERGLIKVISMLTRTFKKVMKHHSEIKDIHERLIQMNENFENNIAEINNKFQSFEAKRAMIMKFEDKLKDLEKQIKSKMDYVNKKQQKLSNGLLEFENHQKNFVNQQKEFYTIQKVILAQNENINIQQNLIAKTQSEIANQQNNFARILKKAKQLYLETKKPTQLSTNISKAKQSVSTTTAFPVTESIKINLFSIPANNNRLEIKDDLIIKEKDEKLIDDLVYKYYFNNTFIDNMIRSKIFTDKQNNVSKNKNKRNGVDTTLLLPIQNAKRNKRCIITSNSTTTTPSIKLLGSTITNALPELTSPSDPSIDSIYANSSSILNDIYSNISRSKRWINYTHKNKHHKSTDLNNKLQEAKVNTVTPKQNTEIKALNNVSSPFVVMAKKFCVEIGQNISEQILSWCIEKTLRRLHIMNTHLLKAHPKVITEKIKENKEESHTQDSIKLITPVHGLITERPLPKTSTYTLITETAYISPIYQIANQEARPFFPDNDELESNLKQFDLTPDPEGNFYYDGSLHASDVIAGPNSGGSDILSDFENNSHMDIDPYTLYLQAMRRASVKRINEDILRKIKKH